LIYAIDKMTANNTRGGRRELRRLSLALAGTILGCTLVSACRPEEATERPNVLFIVLDTTRADRLGVYGHDRPTTPFLDQWSKGALVFEDCQSVAGTTVPAHASMFTGLLPSTHLNDNLHPTLAEKHTTLAELLKKDGYQSFLFSANPFISAESGFGQGFELVQHPWSDEYRAKAVAIIRSKIDPADKSSELPRKFRRGRVGEWAIKACGEVAQDALVAWLDKRDKERPYFAFINYMEAHRPLLPPRSYRNKMMSAKQVAQSYRIDVSWDRMWEYVFGLAEYSPRSREVISLTYDAAVAELDEHLRLLLTTLKDRGDLKNTVIVITADHGEHLGEHHFLDHQYSLYQPLLKVPMILWYPKSVQPGRNTDPVSNIDVFPTILELVGIDAPVRPGDDATSLLHSKSRRVRPSEHSSPPEHPITDMRRLHPSWDPTPFRRQLRSVLEGNYKLIWSSDKRHALYDLASDPGELNNLFGREPELASAMLGRLPSLSKRDGSGGGDDGAKVSATQNPLLIPLGYASTSGVAEE